jgi:hypothetical protein
MVPQICILYNKASEGVEIGMKYGKTYTATTLGGQRLCDS